MPKLSKTDLLLKKIRTDYTFGKLEEKNAAKNPFVQFENWFRQAFRAKIPGVNAFMLATAGPKPSARVLLMKSFSPAGLVFYTHYDSRKGRDLKAQDQAEAVFYWPEAERQVRIFGRVRKLSRRESENYFKTRPRESQIGCWLSHQSRSVKSRAVMETKLRELANRFEGKTVPLPSFWGGYRLIPSHFEFWQGRANRLNDRLLYKKSAGSWKISRLQP